MIGVEAKVLQKMTEDDCRESVFQSAQSVFVISSESKPIFWNEEDELFNLLLFASERKKVHSVTSFYCEVFCSQTGCCFGDATQAEHKSKHWFTVGGGLEITKTSTDAASLQRAGRPSADS